MPRKPLSKREYVVKVLDLIEYFGGGGPACRYLAEKWGVTRQTVYNWSSYKYAVEPIPPNKDKLLRLWYYYCRNHKGDRRHDRGPEPIQKHQGPEPTIIPAIKIEGTMRPTGTLNPDKIGAD